MDRLGQVMIFTAAILLIVWMVTVNVRMGNLEQKVKELEARPQGRVELVQIDLMTS